MPSAATAKISSTVDDAEVARFSAIAEEWWDVRGKFAPLHQLNPVRIAYLRDQLIRHFFAAEAGHGESATPLANLSLVDIGCGGGLVAEPMARLGATVTGIDASATNIRVAELHAGASGTPVTYRATTAEQLALEGAQFDVVLALEIIEHVADVSLFYDALIALVKPGGVLILSTLNRTAKSYALGIIGAERLLRWLPKGTHTWSKFIKPSEMAAALRQRGLRVVDVTGISFSPINWSFSLNTKDLDVNYLLVATAAN
ncbi:MAG: bifunctional 2-polyprenyl-6-hydroxyphenol methylase/3-demethylubiquinol 3-O-methyltransferase UbiG [Alphaproteobacteria bacterium]|nr:bifunctional 2-polyprenyl-6-hydroxyphenol methylase/3-demethylubiquinol 3-O-methyltransferase UbiG [Alphaproteobacteria bacterium]